MVGRWVRAGVCLGVVSSLVPGGARLAAAATGDDLVVNVTTARIESGTYMWYPMATGTKQCAAVEVISNGAGLLAQVPAECFDGFLVSGDGYGTVDEDLDVLADPVTAEVAAELRAVTLPDGVRSGEFSREVGSGSAGVSVFDSASYPCEQVTVGVGQSGGSPYGGAVPGDCELNVAPDWDDWHAGDVHAHAAGDTSLAIHPFCDGRTDVECAELMVRDVRARAANFDTEWIVFSEHAPWLGYNPEDDNEPIYDAAQGGTEWDTIRDVVEETSSTAMRGLMGAELGTAAPACGVPNGGDPLFFSPGHYGVYSTPAYIPDDIMGCNETGDSGLVGTVDAVGGFGGINHPDAADRGSPWHCLTSQRTDSGDLEGREAQPQLGRYDRCTVGVDQYASGGAFKTMEIISGHGLPSAKTLSIWDMYLQNGHRIAAVAGSDGHTVKREAKGAGVGDYARCLANTYKGEDALKDCIEAIAPAGSPNHNKVGGSGRTFAHYDQNPLVWPDYDSTDPEDPARVAMQEGRTTASNGPAATTQIHGQYPGSTVAIPGGDSVSLRVDWETEWKTVGDTLGFVLTDVDPDTIGEDADPDKPGQNINPQDNMRIVSGGTPDRIVIVTGSTEKCGRDRFRCASATHRQVIPIVDGDTVIPGVDISDDHADITVDSAAEGYVRAELYWDTLDDDANTNEQVDEYELAQKRDVDDESLYRSFLDGDTTPSVWDFAAYTSPIYLTETETTSISGQLVDGGTSAPVAGAPVEFCRTTPVPSCVTRTTGPDGTWPTASVPVGNWVARAFPPDGSPV